MFEKVLQELRAMEQLTQIAIPVEPDKDGYIDKECPNTECLFQFKVLEVDWKNKFSDEEVHCPMCNFTAASNRWFTTEQVEASKEKIQEHLASRLHNAFREDARRFNSRQPSNSFLKMSMKVDGGHKSEMILPLSSAEEMELKICCKSCSSRYAVIGSAFFCPCCGHNSAEETFFNAIKKIREKIANIPVIHTSLLSVSKDTAANTCRSLIETGLQECVVAFQRFNEVLFARKFPNVAVKTNAFQKIDVGGDYWKHAVGESYVDWISSKEMKQLTLYFQRRHLLAHTEGIVDQKYIDRSGDQVYGVGQRIVVKEADVLECVSIIEKIVTRLNFKTSSI
jgi:hypothetical protein